MTSPAHAALPPLPAAMHAALAAAYATPPRAYHNLDHVGELLRHYDHVAGSTGWAQPLEVYLAMLYHDAVYEAGRRDNEARSAEMAQAAIARDWPGPDIDVARVTALIEATARHGMHVAADFPDTPEGHDMRRFLDCDMAILGAPAAVFDAYDRGIAAEYRHVPRWLYAHNRRRFLKALLGRARIFLNDDFHARFDAPARHNLRRAVTTKR